MKSIGYALLAEALGSASQDFVHALLGQLANAGSHGGEIDAGALNFMLAVIKGIKPKDQLETMLAAQMAAVHMASMTFARRLGHVDTIDQQDSAERALNKLMRTFTTQMEALKRYRTGGEQKMTVQHVSVSEGGQAIVGNVTQTSRDAPPAKAADAKAADAKPALVDARQQPMETIGEPKQEAVPVPARRTQKDDQESSA